MGILPDRRSEAIDRAFKATTELLAPLGFEKGESCVWSRQSRWKLEVVDLLLRRDDTEMLPSLRVGLPAIDAYLAQINVSRLLTERATHTDIPWFGPKIGAFVAGLVDDLRAALPWFDQFSTPALFMENLSRYQKPESPLYVEAMDYLSSLRVG